MQKYQLFIDGAFVDPVKNEWFETVDPYRGEPWALIPRGTAEDANRAVEAADRAMMGGAWATMTATARGALLRKLGDLVVRDAERLAEIDREERAGGFQETGRPVALHGEICPADAS